MKEVEFVRTVLADIGKDKVGFTLPHEHLQCTQLCVFSDPISDEQRILAHETVTKENATIVRENPLSNLDNIYLPGGSLVEEELRKFVRLGGKTIVDLTTIGLGRNIHEIVRLSQVTGLNVIAGTGYYIAASHPLEVTERNEEWLCSQMITEIDSGIDGTNYRAGVIGEIGTSSPIHKREEKILCAAAQASNKSGYSIIVHVQPPAWLGHEVLDILFNAGARPERVVLAHMDSTLTSGLAYHREILERGVTIMYDGFGTNWDFPSLGLKMPSDEERINAVVALVDENYSERLLLSHDVCTKAHLGLFDGPGYTHLTETIIPNLVQRGCTRAELDQMTRSNPIRILMPN